MLPSQRVFVDELQHRGTWKYGDSCHLLPLDTSPEAVARVKSFGRQIGLRAEWFQEAGKYPHWDLNAGRRKRAVAYGATEISDRGWMRMYRLRSQGWFIEPGTGYKMIMGLHYVISDSGSSYSAVGFETREKARAEAKRLRGYDITDEMLLDAELIPSGSGFVTMDAANIVLADDMLIFWAVTEPLLLKAPPVFTQSRRLEDI